MPDPEPAGLHDLACVVHLHSDYSDGTASIPELMEAARVAGCDVVLLTDHDTLGAKDDGHEGWHGSVLLGVGLEVTPRAGHYLAFGIDKAIKHKGLSEADIADAVAEAGGFGFVAHPWSKGARILERYGRFVKRGLPHGWKDLDLDTVAGIELWSLTTDASEDWRGPVDAVRYMRDPEAQLDGPRPEDLVAWDRICESRRFVAIGGLDAHQHGIRVRGRLWSPMRNARYFAILSTYVSPDRGAARRRARPGRPRARLRGAPRGPVLHRGRRDCAGPRLPLLGRVQRRSRDDGRGAPRGDAGPFAHQLPEDARVVLLRNGEPVAQTDGRALEHEVTEPGAYRIEAHRHWRKRERPWIYSNPIYLR